MANIIYRGSTPTLRFRPTNGMNVSDLGTPVVALAQELVYMELDPSVDPDDNSISVTLTEEQTLRLVAGVETKVQQAWVLPGGGNVRFPVKKIEVAESLIESLEPEETTEE